MQQPRGSEMMCQKVRPKLERGWIHGKRKHALSSDLFFLKDSILDGRLI